MTKERTTKEFTVFNQPSYKLRKTLEGHGIKIKGKKVLIKRK